MNLEQQIKDAGADKAPRISIEGIEANIVSEHYFTADQGANSADLDRAVMDAVRSGSGQVIPEPLSLSLTLLTFCVLVLRNGFTVTGESACASPENFDPEIGRIVARKNAVDKVWPLMGYELRSRLAAEPKDFRDRVRAERADLVGRLTKLNSFLISQECSRLPDDEQRRLIAQCDAMRTYAQVLDERIKAFSA